MPTYEYACSSCSHEWEFEQSIKDDALTDCPKCGKATAKRQISRGTGFILKGGGWYSDLYSGSSNSKSSASESSSSSSSSSSTSSSTTSTTSTTPSTSGSSGSTDS